MPRIAGVVAGPLVAVAGVVVGAQDQAELRQAGEDRAGIDLGVNDGRRERNGGFELLARPSPRPVKNLRGGAEPHRRLFGLQFGDERGDGLAGRIRERIPRLLLGLVAADALRLRAPRLTAAAIVGRQFVPRHLSEVR